MKTLQESLFDKDLATRDTFFMPLLKLFNKRLNKQTINDLYNFAAQIRTAGRLRGTAGITSRSYDIKNPDIDEWAQRFIEHYRCQADDLNPIICGVTNKDLRDESEVTDWLKPGKIHTGVCWNDRMYANALAVDWDEWGNSDNRVKNIDKWIMFQDGWMVFVVLDRKEYEDEDRKLIQALIDNISKFKY